MSTQNTTNVSFETIEDGFRERLKNLLEDNITLWAKRLRVSQSTIRARWFVSSFPGADKLIRLKKEGKISIDWLLTGEEQECSKYQDPKYKKYIDVFIKVINNGNCRDIKKVIDSIYEAEGRIEDRGKVCDLNRQLKKLTEEIETLKATIEKNIDSKPKIIVSN